MHSDPTQIVNDAMTLIKQQMTLIRQQFAELVALREKLKKTKWERDDAVATVKLLQQQLKIQNDSFADRLAASQAETRRLALEEAATLAAAFADSEEVEAIASLSESKGVGSPGWRKDAMHSHAQEVSERIARAIRSALAHPSSQAEVVTEIAEIIYRTYGFDPASKTEKPDGTPYGEWAKAVEAATRITTALGVKVG